MMANMISSLFLNGRIETTVVKAKEASRQADKLVTIGKKGDLHRRRLAAARLRNPEAVAKLFAEIAPSYMDRQGGYTRILKLGQRRGDAAETCILMLVDPAQKQAKEAPAAEVKAEEAPKA